VQSTAQTIYFGYQGGTWDSGDNTAAITLSSGDETGQTTGGDIYFGYSDTGQAQAITGTIASRVNICGNTDSTVYINNAGTLSSNVSVQTLAGTQLNNSGHIAAITFTLQKENATAPLLSLTNSGYIGALSLNSENSPKYTPYDPDSTLRVTNTGTINVLTLDGIDGLTMRFEKGSDIEAALLISAENSTLHFAAQAFNITRDYHPLADFNPPAGSFIIVTSADATQKDAVIFDIESSQSYASIVANHIIIGGYDGDGSMTYEGNAELQLNVTGSADDFVLDEQMLLFEALESDITGGFMNVSDGETIEVNGMLFPSR